MQIAYLVNRYPTVSHTFVRREIAGLEAIGHAVHRFSVRAAPRDLPDPADIAERTLTKIVLGQPRAALLFAALGRAATHPGRMLAAWRKTRTMTPRTTRGFIARFAYLVEASWLAKVMERAGIAHLHAHFGTNPAAVARLVGALTGIPYSFTVHGPDEFDEPRQIDLEGKMREARFVVAISDFGRSQLCRWIDTAYWDRIVVVRCGVDFDALSSPADAGPAPVDFCCVARLAPQKGLPILVEAVALLRARGAEVRVAIIGEGDLREGLETQIRQLGLEESIVLLGSRDGAAVAATMRASKAMVLPSFAEGLPVVIMEALAVGTPVITTSVAGIPELVDRACGRVVAPASAVALADAMAEMLDASDADRQAMGEEGRRRVERHHDVARNAALLARYITGGTGQRG